MAGRHPNSWRERDERGHGVVQDAIDKGYAGSGRPYLVPGFPTHEAANEARKVIGRALEHFGFPRAAWVTDGDGRQCYRSCADAGAVHGIGFELHDKNAARSHVARQTGGDIANLKYNPYERRPQPHSGSRLPFFPHAGHIRKCDPGGRKGPHNPRRSIWAATLRASFSETPCI